MLNHLLELRQRAIQLCCCFGALFLILFYFSAELYSALVYPLLQQLPDHQGIVATRITSPVFTPIQLAVNTAMLCSTPIALFHLWRFISPGLYQTERHFLRGLLAVSFSLFLLGILFCYFFILPWMFQLFANSLPKGVRLMPDMAYTLDFITRMLLVFGLCFQVPLICLILVRLQWLSLSSLQEFRPYAIVSAFIIGMLLTPPDVLSQIMLAVPLCILYELGIVLVKLFPQSLTQAK